MNGGVLMLPEAHLDKAPEDRLGAGWEGLVVLRDVPQHALGGEVEEDDAHDAEVRQKVLQLLVYSGAAALGGPQPHKLGNPASKRMKRLHPTETLDCVAA